MLKPQQLLTTPVQSSYLMLYNGHVKDSCTLVVVWLDAADV
jgi:hypothetical protein